MILVFVWFGSLSMRISMSIHVAINGIISFFLWLIFHCVYMCVCLCIYPIFLNQSSISGHFRCVYVLAIGSKAAMNIGVYVSFWGFPGDSEVKASPWNVGDLGLIPGLERSPGEGNGTPLQYSGLETPMEGGAWEESDTTECFHFTYLRMCPRVGLLDHMVNLFLVFSKNLHTVLHCSCSMFSFLLGNT